MSPVRLNSHYQTYTREELEALVEESGWVDGEFRRMAAMSPTSRSSGYGPYPTLYRQPDDTPVAWVEVWAGDTMAAKIAWGTGEVKGLDLDDYSEYAPEVLGTELDTEYRLSPYEQLPIQGNGLLELLKLEGKSIDEARDYLLARWPHSEVRYGTVYDYNEASEALYEAGEKRWPYKG